MLLFFIWHKACWVKERTQRIDAKGSFFFRSIDEKWLLLCFMAIYIHVPPLPPSSLRFHHSGRTQKAIIWNMLLIENRWTKKMFAEKMSIDLKKRPMEMKRSKKCALLPKNSNCFLATHTQLDTKSEFFSSFVAAIDLTCIGFLGRQQLFDDDVFIYGSLPLFDQRILSSVFFSLIFGFHSSFFNAKYLFRNQLTFVFIETIYTYMCILSEFGSSNEKMEKNICRQ